MAVTAQTAAGLAAQNPRLASGQVVVETDTGRMKVGTDGLERWSDIDYSGYTPEYVFPEAIGADGTVLKVDTDALAFEADATA